MTHTTKHTPGPWVVETTNTLPGECADNVHRLCYPGYRIHGICAIWNNTRTSKANATLIAAAPAMYLELQNIVEGLTDEITRIIEGNKPDTARLDYLANKAGQAVAQAEGR